MKNTKAFIATALFAMTPIAGFAGGLSEPVVAPAPTPAPMAAPVMQSADWTGFYFGAQIGTGELSSDDLPDDANSDYSSFGGHAGYMYDLGTFVLGAEIDYDQLDVEDISSDIDYSQTRLKLRAGYDLGQFLPYLTAGVVSLDVTDGTDDANESGTVIGAGIVYAITDNFLVGGEYLQNSYDGEEIFEGDLSFDEFSLRASYKF